MVDALVDHAVIAEMLLGMAGGGGGSGEEEEEGESDEQRQQKMEVVDPREAESAKYLKGGVRYEKDRLVDEEEEGVMMEWEAPLMEAHAGNLSTVDRSVKAFVYDMILYLLLPSHTHPAGLLCGEDGDRDVINIGFGMVSRTKLLLLLHDLSIYIHRHFISTYCFHLIYYPIYPRRASSIEPFRPKVVRPIPSLKLIQMC